MSVGTCKSRDGVKLSYHLWNGTKSKRWIIFIHGLGGNLTAWDPILKPLRHLKVNLVAVDLRGQGHSGRPRNKEAYEFHHNAEDIIDLMNHLKIKKASLVGHSSGAVVAMDAAARFPRRVKSTVLLGPNYESPLKKRLIPEFALKGTIYFLSSLLILVSKIFPHKKLTYPNYGRLKTSSGLYTFYQDMLGNTLDIYVWNLRVYLNTDLTDALPRIKAPTLIVYGRNDWIASKSIVKRMASKIPDCTVELLKDAGHQLMFDNRDELGPVLKKFIEGHE